MSDKAKEFLNLYVQSIINDTSQQFEDSLFEGITKEMDKDRIYAKMILNSISLSVKLSTQIIIDMLDHYEILKITSDEQLLQKLLLKIRTDISDQ